jgi:glutathione transport system substrate-binding protein
MFNTAYYKNPAVDRGHRQGAGDGGRREKAKLYADAQKRIWKDAPWAFLVTEQLLSAHAKGLSGFYVMPDASFNFDDVVELK